MPKIIDHDQRRDEIVDVTWQLIVEGGIEAATMREIASRAGFANGALKHYFTGKDQIITGAYERSLNSLGDRLTAYVAGKRGIEALEMFMRYTLPVEQEDATAARVLLSFWERCAFSAEVRGGYDEHLDTWKAGYLRYLAEGREDGDIRTSTPDDQLADEIIMMNIGATVIRVVSPDHLHVDVLERQVTDFITRLRRAD
ncbi:TetR family transcriptional regulator [Leucobacter sp. OLJS4]|uniref:TetR/AcrR family transcriptional regulator n=1 Tax=unclassified Leucobacter TaxID=2621730 RepID=UPI000C18C139|nr:MULTISPECIES: TetR/AcrR family transcriptional regulator [unclassified Leucobacter]PII99263.1 TetR family transcriptional regulator [Leucobacter sp. OLES1]PII83346.1 TetR family transcriptional regulator [Leucobacter sp. OLCALW19]PII86896.1 TetR family transcriptional regulator [Leucobacter sp. OLTLW20]PII91168.1 TetR family transcriptional regulator [Leucobacter sp. OLAS13]PII98627.1 TetR family transcriptional regulator [Leucobacter sp. OLDS2]